MEPVCVTYDTLADSIYVDLYVGAQEEDLPARHHSREIDFHRHMEFDKDDRLLGINFLVASRGIDLRGVPEAERIAAGLEQLRSTLGLVLVS